MDLQYKLLSKLAAITSYKSAVTPVKAPTITSPTNTNASSVSMREVGEKYINKPLSTGSALNGVRKMQQPVINNVLRSGGNKPTTPKVPSMQTPLNKLAAEYVGVEGYPGYFVSKDGVVYSNHYGGMNPLKPRLAHNGYQRVYMRNGESKKREDQYIHRLVAKAYLDNKDNYTIVNHKDCDRTNNNVNNLEWTTSAGNNTYTLDNNRAYRDEFGRFHSV